MTGVAAWLVQGDDDILIAERTRSLVAELLAGEDPTLALEDVGADADLAGVADACRTPPFLAGRRVVIVREIDSRTTDELAPILAYLEDPLPTTALVMVAGGASRAGEGRRLSSKLLTAVKAHGQVVSTAVSGREAGGWLRQRINASPVRLDRPAEALLEAHLGEDVSRLGALLDVLGAAYGEGATLSAADLEPYLGEAGGVAPWDLTDAIDTGNAAAALVNLHRMLEGGQRHPLAVLATLHRHVQSILRVDDPAVTSEAQAAEAMGIARGRSTFPAKKALAAARLLGSARVAEAVGLVADAEVAIKGGIDWPAPLVLELAVARLCQLARRSGAGAKTATGSRR